MIITAAAAAQNPEPTQTPYIIYVVVTPTPQPVPVLQTQPETGTDPVIQRPTQPASISLVNGDTQGSDIQITNPSHVTTTDDLVQSVVATVMAQANTTAGGSTSVITNNTASGGGALVTQADGTTCTMNFELVGEPTYPAGALVPRGEAFWKEWEIRNTGTCTWTQDWYFVFDSGWQIGSTRFSMKRNTAPGQILNVRLGMIPDQQQDGNYYSTYIFEAPDGTRFGTITSSYTVKSPSYFAPKPTIPPQRPKHGRPGPYDPWCPGCPYPPPCPPPCPPYW